jgi:phospholipase C
LNVTDLAYKSGNHPLRLDAGSSHVLALRLGRSHQWYDFNVTVAGASHFLRRYAGRVETGKSGFSDPAMA